MTGRRWVLVRAMDKALETERGRPGWFVTDIGDDEEGPSFERRLGVSVVEYGRDLSEGELDRLEDLSGKLECVADVMET